MSNELLLEKLEDIDTSPLTGRNRRWVPLDDVLAIVRQHHAEAICPYVVTSGTTSYCRLADQNGPRATDHRRLKTAIGGLRSIAYGDAHTWPDCSARKVAKQALLDCGGEKNMGDASTRKDEGVAETANVTASPASDSPKGYSVMTDRQMIERLRDALHCMVNATMYKDHPAESEFAIEVLEDASDHLETKDAGAQRGEIRVVDEVRGLLAGVLLMELDRNPSDPVTIASLNMMMEVISPYLRTTEPVSVSLAKVAIAWPTQLYGTGAESELNQNKKYYLDLAKAVLDSAGVKYVE